MGFSRGPKIITNGLAFLIDGASQKSYSGTGTTWSDLSGNNHDISLVNGVGYSTDNNGILTFDGVEDYGITNDVIISSPTSLTIGGWVRKNGEGANYETTLHQSSDSTIGNSSYWFGFDLNNLIVGTIGANTGVGWSAGQTTLTASFGTWYFIVSTWDGSNVYTYVNNSLEKQYALTTYTNLTTPTRIGASGNASGYLMNGSISNVFIYKNKSFSSNDVFRMYNSTKSRFGL